MGAASHPDVEHATIQRGKAGKVKAKPLLEPLAATAADSGSDQSSANSAFARALGSVDYLTRERGVQALTRLLQRKTDITEADMTKLWKGLYFCFWHSDKAPVQAELAGRLSCILGQVSDPVAWLYFSVFLTTMRREWFSIDHLRLDKFLMLVRKFIAQMFSYLQAKDWEPELVARYTAFLQDRVLLPPPSEHHRAAGLAYHIADVYIPELRAALATDPPTTDPPLSPVAARQLLQPFVAALQLGREDALVNRVRDSVFEPLVAEARGDDEDGEEAGGAGVLRGAVDTAAFAAELFDIGSQPDVRARNRAALYGVSQELERAGKKRAKRDGQQQAAAGGKKAGKAAAAGPAAAVVAVAAPAASPVKTVPVAAAEQAAAAAPVAGEQKGANGHVQGKRKRGVAAAAAATPAAAAAVVPAAATPLSAAQTQPRSQATPKAAAAATPATASQQQAGQAAAATPISIGAAVPAAATPAGASSAAQPQPQATRSALKQPKQPKVAATPAATSTPQPPASTAAATAPAAAAAAAAPASQQQQQTRSAKRTRDGQPQGTPAAAASQQHAHVHFADAGANGSAQAAPGTAKAVPHAAGAVEPTPKPSAKKTVRINLKKNLYFAFNGPVPDAMVRTPPSSRSKGGILKKTSLTPTVGGHKAQHRLALAAGSQSAPPKTSGQQQQQQQRKSPAFITARPAARRVVTPNSVPRARAADFFA